MPVFEVTVARVASVTDTLVIQADDAAAAQTIACEAAGDWDDWDVVDTSVESWSELSSDQALQRASEVVSDG